MMLIYFFCWIVIHINHVVDVDKSKTFVLQKFNTNRFMTVGTEYENGIF